MQKFLDQLDDNLIYVNDEILEKTIYIDCTVDKLDYYIRGYKTRILKDMNFGDKYVVLRIKLPIYYVDKTKKKSFVHPLNCCEWKSRRTKRLDSYLLENIKESSAIGMERTLKKSICEVSDTSIIRLLKKKQSSYTNYEKYKKIGIDDFAFKKKLSYGTVFISHDERKIINIIDSRIQEDVTNELKKFPSLETVTRDGASLYRGAISNANSNILQVSDRFHLIKNCIEAIKDDLKKLTDKHINLSEETYDLSFIKLELSNREKSIVARKNKKQELINKIRADYNENSLTKTELSKKYKLELKTVNRYLCKDATIPRRNNITKLNEYAKEIFSMLIEQSNSNYNYRVIHSHIAELGYDESYENFYKQLRLRIIDNDLHAPLTIGRNQFHKLLYGKPISELFLTKECEKALSLFLQKENEYSQALQIISCFSSIIKNESSLGIEELVSMVLSSTKFEKWISTKTFFEGVNRDIIAVKNQIEIKETNSTTEGFVSKIKTIKKRTFGRASFNYLKSVLLLP